MTAPIQYPLINGVRHSFSSIELKIAGQIFTGFKSANYSRKRSRTMVRGNHPDPLGKTRGTNEYSADVEMFLAEFNLLQATIQAVTAGYGDVFFTVTVTYSENGFDTLVDEITGCTLDSTDASNSQGTDPTVRKFELNPIKIKFNGLDDCAVPLTGVVT